MSLNVILSLVLLLSQSWNRLDYEIRSKMLDYWVGLGWIGCTVFHPSHYTTYHAGVWFGSVWFGSGVWGIVRYINMGAHES